MNSVQCFQKMKQNEQKITMMTCYDYTSAMILDNTDIDCILVGDSVGMVVYGYDNTIPVTVELMALHTQAVKRGIKNKFIIADMPFMSYHKSLSETMDAVQKLIVAGASAVKLEGVAGNEAVIKHIIASGVPVMGHIGLTIQAIHTLGGFKLQGKSESQQQALLQQAKTLEDLGCFAVVLECMPTSLAEKITQQLRIPTIGIGAGSHTDGQVLVFHDALGLQTVMKPKFVKYFLDGESLVSQGVNDFVTAVKTRRYPDQQHAYSA